MDNINTNEISDYTSLINTYGATAVVLAVFIAVFLFLLLYLIKSNKKTNDHIIKQQEELLNKIIESEEENKNPKKEKNIVELFVKINDSIGNILENINDEIDANRLSIYVFHNGAYSSHGLPFFKTSCIGEVIKKNSGVSKEIKTHTSLPLGMFDNTIKTLYNTGKVCILNSETETRFSALTNMMKNNNIKSGIGIAIYDIDNNIIGVIIAEFINPKESLDIVEKILIQQCQYLVPILEFSNVNSNNK